MNRLMFMWSNESIVVYIFTTILSINVFFTSALSSNHQGFLRFTPAHCSASREAEPVGLLRGESGDSKLASVGAHFHCGPSLGVPAVETVGYLVAW